MTMRTICLFLSIALFQTTLSAQNMATRSLPAFDEIAISGGYDKVILKEGGSESITIEAEGVNPEDIVTEVKGNTLNVKMKKGSYKKSKINLSISYRSLKSVSNSGSSDIHAENPIKGDSFEFNSSGSGDFTGAFDVKKLNINISGSSDMKLSGKADKQAYAISGSGDVDAAKLSGGEADVAISGSGDISLNVSGPVRSAVSGSGKVNNQK